MITTSRPDIVIINTNTNPTSVMLVELTIPFTSNIEAANRRKRERYEFLTSDINEAGYKCNNLPLEVGSRGYITARNRETLIYLCHTFGIRKFQQVIKNSSKLALLGSYAIFLARSAPDWSGSGVLKPWKLYHFLLNTLYTLFQWLYVMVGVLLRPHLWTLKTVLLFCCFFSKIWS